MTAPHDPRKRLARQAVSGLAAAAVAIGAPGPASAQFADLLAKRLSRSWSASFPDLGGRTPGLKLVEGERVFLDGPARSGSVLASAAVTHAVTGVLRVDPRVTGRPAEAAGKLAGTPVFAVSLKPEGQIAWCRWIAAPRKPVVPLVDAVSTGACYTQAQRGPFKGVAQEAAVFAPEGLYVSQVGAGSRIVPGLMVALADVEIGGPMRLMLVLEQIRPGSLVLVEKVTWPGGEAVLDRRELPLAAEAATSIQVYGEDLALVRLAGGEVRARRAAGLPTRPPGPPAAGALDDAAVVDVYPPAAKLAEVEGSARLHCRVDARGLLDGCLVLGETPSGHGFGEAALRLSARLRMQPLIDSQTWMIVPVTFKLPAGATRIGTPAP